MALDTLYHRGPDSWGEWYDDAVYIGHRRLSILDLSSNGHQPMVDAQESRVIAANGEIYNFRALRRELEPEHAFRSDSDSEVLLHGYTSWGIEGLLDKLEGMYAFCVYDRTRRKLFLARDRVGIKPLYFAVLGDTIAWASELKAISAFFPSNVLEPDASALYDFLTYLYVPAPKTAFRNVFKLEPAHYAEVDIDSGRIVTSRYWALEPREQPISVQASAERLRSLIRECVGEQMVSDVPVGFFLSGGMDSSVVVAEATRCATHLRTYSIGFDAPHADEIGFARQVAETFDTHHCARRLERSDASRLFGAMDGWYDEPFADTSALPTYLVASLARESVTVALTGDGGDEVFGGYLWYLAFRRKVGARVRLPEAAGRALRSAPRMLGEGRIRRLLRELRAFTLLDDAALYANVRKRALAEDKPRARGDLGIPADYDDYWHYRKYYREDLPLMTRLQYVDFHTYLPDQVLTKVDRATMAVSLEARVPLLGTKLVEFAFNLPENIRYAGGRLKGALKDTYRQVLPSAILERDKRGFSIPLERWRSDLIEGPASREEAILARWFARRSNAPSA